MRSRGIKMTRGARRSSSGITLIEVLVVAVILGVTAYIALPLFEQSRRNARLKTCQAQLAAIYQAEEAYRVRNRTYTINLSVLSGSEYLGAGLRCPTGATYQILPGATGIENSVQISCTSSGNDAHTRNPVYSGGELTDPGAP